MTRLVVLKFIFHPDSVRSMNKWSRVAGVTRVNLLPYHTLGRDKYQKMERSCTHAKHVLVVYDDLDASHHYSLAWHGVKDRGAKGPADGFAR